MTNNRQCSGITVLFTCFYRVMHFSVNHSIAIACRLSVCPYVCDVGEL